MIHPHYKRHKQRAKRHTRSMCKHKQSGVSLIEVLVAMFILAFGALAIVNLHTASAIAIGHSADHFRISELSQGIVEQLKADSSRAAAGDYNTGFAEATAKPGSSDGVTKKINSWKTTVARSIPRGETSIQCDADECDVVLRWHEVSHDGVADQTFNVKTPL